MRRSIRRHVPIIALLAATLLAGGPARSVRAADPDPCSIDGVERVVAIADVHGGHAQFVSILKAAGLIDARERWIGGKAHFVQTGDVVDRGGNSRDSLDLLKRLEEEAVRAGGRVHALLGNHEAMRMLGDYRYVSAGDYSAFETDRSRDRWNRAYRSTRTDAEQRARAAGEKFDENVYRAQFEKEIPLGLLELRDAFAAQGVYGKWLRGHAATARINGVQFLHGGISPASASLGCSAINETVRADITKNIEQTRQAAPRSLAAREDGPLWYRGLALEPEEVFAPELETILSKLGARAIVVGHTVAPNGTIRARFGGRVFQIDTGMLDADFFPGGKPSALEIVGDTVTAIYTDRREPLGTLK